ncbi:MAG: hypothetical protein FJ297_06050 [Planctomycetes bacterium]|nr:hypothetical protein [Planctomycetota bacterium]
MADEFDRYREALVMETETVWPDGIVLSDADRARCEDQLHASPEPCGQLEYIRIHTGFRRRIIVTPAELARLGLA